MIGFCNVPLFTHIFCWFPEIFIEKTTFDGFEEYEIHYNDEKEKADSSMCLL